MGSSLNSVCSLCPEWKTLGTQFSSDFKTKSLNVLIALVLCWTSLTMHSHWLILQKNVTADLLKVLLTDVTPKCVYEFVSEIKGSERFSVCFFFCISFLFLSSFWCLWFMPRLWLLFAAHVLFIDFNTICYFGNKNLINKKGDSFATSRVKEQDLESRLLLLSPQRPTGPFLCQQNRHAKSWASLKYYFWKAICRRT